MPPAMGSTVDADDDVTPTGMTTWSPTPIRNPRRNAHEAPEDQVTARRMDRATGELGAVLGSDRFPVAGGDRELLH